MANFIAGFVVATLIFLFGFARLIDTGVEANKVVHICELSLVRDEYCEIVALPINRKRGNTGG